MRVRVLFPESKSRLSYIARIANMASSSVNANLAPSPVLVGSPALRRPASLPLPLPSPSPLPLQSTHTPSPFLPYPTPLSSLSMDTSPGVATTNTSKDFELAMNRYSSVALRALAFLFSFSSSLAMAAPPPQPRRGEEPFSFKQHPQLTYFLVVVILSSIYSAAQFLKGMWNEFAYKGFIVPSKISDYLNFFLDQMMAYLLFSASTLAVSEMGRTKRATIHAAIIASLVLSFSAFVAMAASAVRSGYQLSKRISW